MNGAERTTIRKLKTENIQIKTEFAQLRDKYARLTIENTWLRAEKGSSLDDVLKDPKWLHDLTGLDGREFEWICKRFEKAIKNSKDASRFSEYANEPGNTCILPVRHVLLIALTYKRTAAKQGMLAALARVDQSTISRYVTLADHILVEIIPTAEKIGGAMRNTAKDVKKFMPGRGAGELYIDATYAQVERPAKDQEKMYSGKRKRHVYNVQVTSNKDLLILDVGLPEDGSTHDIHTLRANPPNLGSVIKSMKDKNTPQEQRVTLYTDMGYAGIQKEYPGIISKQPYKRSKLVSLTEGQKEYNKRVSRKRIRIEHAIGRLKCFRRMSAVYDENKERFFEEIQIVSGLVNLHILLADRKYVNVLRKTCQ